MSSNETVCYTSQLKGPGCKRILTATPSNAVKISYDVEEREQVGDWASSRYEDADDVMDSGQYCCARHMGHVFDSFTHPVLDTVRVENVIAVSLEKSILRNLFKADGALALVRVN
jgi:hypothetical protein